MKFLNKILVPLMLLASISLSAQTKVACILGDTVALNLLGTRGDIQWQISNDSISWTDLVGQQSEQLEFISSLPMQWLRASITENNCPVYYEDPIRIQSIDTSEVSYLSNTIVLDTLNIQLLPNSLQQQTGLYSFNCLTYYPALRPGDILINTDDEGFLCVVDYYILQDSQLFIQTHSATLDELLGDASINFNFDLDSLHSNLQAMPLNLVDFNIQNSPNCQLLFESLSINPSGNYQGQLNYSSSNGLQAFSLETNNTQFDVQDIFIANVNQPVNSISGLTELVNYSKNSVFYADNIPVVFTLSLKLDATYTFTSDASNQIKFGHHNSVNTVFNLSLTNGIWNNSTSFNENGLFDSLNCQGNSNATMELVITPHIELKVFGEKLISYDGPLSVGLEANNSPSSLDWDARTEGFVNVKIESDSLNILGAGLSQLDTIFYESPHYFLSTPNQLELVSGDNQLGYSNQALSQPIVVRVKDSNGNPQRNVPVKFSSNEAGALDSILTRITDSNGLVQFDWMLGPFPTPMHELNLSVLDASLNEIAGSPLLVHATSEVGCGTLTSITDVDGNIYPVIEIGNQCWTRTNLKTAHFADGSPIDNIIDNNEWFNQLSTNSPPPAGAWSVPNLTYESVYGKLYNWFATVNPSKLCPIGWHVPSDLDWTIVENFLGGSSIAGDKMMSTGQSSDGTGLWGVPNPTATNESGFSALPGRERDAVGNFWTNYTNAANFHTSTEDLSEWPFGTWSWSRRMGPILQGAVARDSGNKQNGYSVRCIKD